MNTNAPPIFVPGSSSRVKMSWYETNQKNKPQGNSVAGGLLLMLVSGLHISYGIFNYDTSIKYHIEIIKSSWYVGVVLAGFVAHFLIDKWEKKIFYYIGSISCAVGSCMFFEPMANYEECIILGRFLAGIGHGIVYMPMVIHSGENSVKEMRGMLLSSINYCIMMSVATGSIFNLMINSGSTSSSSGSTVDNYIDPKFITAILGLVYSVMALIFIPLMFYESPVFLIRKNRNREALVNMIKLRSEQTETMEIRSDFEDLRQMIQEDKQISSNIFKDFNIRPLLFVTVSKLLHSFSFNYPLNLFRLYTVIFSFIFSSNNTLFWIPLVLVFTRSIFGIFALFGMDRIGRKKLITVSAGLCGITLIALGISYQIFASLYLLASVTFFILFDIFSTVGIGMVSDVLASEAFPITKKSLSITFANTVDTIFNIILIIVTKHVWSETFIYFLLFGFGTLLVLGGFFFHNQLPETKMMSLRQSRDVLRGKTSQQLPEAHHNI